MSSEEAPASPIRMQRCPAVFRMAHQRVLVRVLGGQSFDLLGGAAAVWLATDDPGTLTDVGDRLAASGLHLTDLAAIVRTLRHDGLLVEAAQ